MIDIVQILLDQLELNPQDKKELRDRIYAHIFQKIAEALSGSLSESEINQLNNYIGTGEENEIVLQILQKDEYSPLVNEAIFQVISEILNNEKIVPPTKKDLIKANLISQLINTRWQK